MNITIIIAAAVISFGLTALLGFVIIPWLQKLKFGQTILDIGPKWHQKKQGTPTMGGMMFIIGITLSAAAVIVIDMFTGNAILPTDEIKGKVIGGLIMAICFGMIGFADDYIKVVKKRNLGLSIGQKTVLQILVCAAYLYSLYLSMGKEPHMYVPFVGNTSLGIVFWILGACVLYGAINAVNFTDGIDGLCSSVTATVAASFIVIAFMRNILGAGLLAASLLGGCVGFLVWNKNPAKVFMGDTGSMFLGGVVVALAYAVDCPLILLPVGIVYVIEALSDVIQIGYFKLTGGKRIFKMAPIHHHFEMSGWKENKIVRVFTFVSIIGGIAGILIIYFSQKVI